MSLSPLGIIPFWNRITPSLFRRTISTMTIDYNHAQNTHTKHGSRAAFAKLINEIRPASVLDVGCGTGTWLRAALDNGVVDVLGIDGIQVPADEFQVHPNAFRCFDLTQPVDLGRRFDLVLCLEVAEHLEEAFANTLLATLVRHSDCILFSAACPGQTGQHHVNCKWPHWWQRRFNAVGYACGDEIRSKLWDESVVEPWYRQNIFMARKDPDHASYEPRLRSLVHPDMLPALTKDALLRDIEHGKMPLSWYLEIPFRAVTSKVRRRGAFLTSK